MNGLIPGPLEDAPWLHSARAGRHCRCQRLTPALLGECITRHVASAIHRRAAKACVVAMWPARFSPRLPFQDQHQNRRRLPLFAPADRHNGLFSSSFESDSDMGRYLIGCAPSHLPQTAICPKREQSETAPSGPWFWLAGEILTGIVPLSATLWLRVPGSQVLPPFVEPGFLSC